MNESKQRLDLRVKHYFKPGIAEDRSAFKEAVN